MVLLGSVAPSLQILRDCNLFEASLKGCGWFFNRHYDRCIHENAIPALKELVIFFRDNINQRKMLD